MAADPFEHRCQRSDDLEAELLIARNLLLFGRFTVDRVPPFPEGRRQLLKDLHQRYAWRTAALVKAANQAPRLAHTPSIAPAGVSAGRIPLPRTPSPGEARLRGRA